MRCSKYFSFDLKPADEDDSFSYGKTLPMMPCACKTRIGTRLAVLCRPSGQIIRPGLLSLRVSARARARERESIAVFVAVTVVNLADVTEISK